MACDDPWFDHLGEMDVYEYEGCMFRPISDDGSWTPFLCGVDEPIEAVCGQLRGAPATSEDCPDFVTFLDQIGWNDNASDTHAQRCLEANSNLPYDTVWWAEEGPDPDPDAFGYLYTTVVFDSVTSKMVGVTWEVRTRSSLWERYCCSGYAVTAPVWGRWFDLVCAGPGTWNYEPDDFR